MPAKNIKGGKIILYPPERKLSSIGTQYMENTTENLHSPALSSDAIGQAMAQLKENPEILGNIASALGISLPSSLTPAFEKSEDGASADESEQAHTQETQKSSLNIPPELLSKLPLLLSVLSPGKEKSAGASILQGKSSDDKRTALLKALKPYLNPQRRSTVDKIIGISELGSVFKQK